MVCFIKLKDRNAGKEVLANLHMLFQMLTLGPQALSVPTLDLLVCPCLSELAARTFHAQSEQCSYTRRKVL